MRLGRSGAAEGRHRRLIDDMGTGLPQCVHLALTVSGRHKGRLTRDDILLADADGRSLDARSPSAETALHCQVYRRFPEAGCVLHPHTVNATLLSRLHSGHLVLRDYELLKAFAGIDTHRAGLST